MRALLILPALVTPVAAAAADAVKDGPVLAAAAGPAELFVELVINGQAGGALASVIQDGDRLMVDSDALRQAGVAVTDTGKIDAAHWPGVRATYDAAGQRLLLDLPAELLPTRRISAPAEARMTPIVDTGGLLNYDAFLQVADGHASASVWSEQRAFGTIANTGIASIGGVRDGYVRLDTHYSLSREEQATEVTVGDLITRALSWSTAVRIGGVQLSRSFALRPDLITVPLPSFAGEAAVPTGVDLFINGYRQSRSDVAPGRFVLDSVPVVNGAGEARIVTTDAVGRQIATVIPFYVAPELLRPGLTDFSVEAGALRKNYGVDSFNYRRAVVSASARHGLTSRLTLSGHAEATPGMAGGGIGAAWAPGLWGALSGAVAVSEARGVRGTQITAGYSFTARQVSIGAEHVGRSHGFIDLGRFDLGLFTGSARSDRVSIGMPVHGVGSLGLGYIASRVRDGSGARLGSASFSTPLGRRASAFAAVDYDFGRSTVSAQLRLVMPLGRSTVVSGGVAHEANGSGRLQASVARPSPTAGGLGYSADLAWNTRGSVLGQASASWRASRVQLEAGVASSGAAQSAWASASGAIAFLQGRAFLANSLPDAFAVVSTGMAGVPVYYENQIMGKTDGSGRLFVSNVSAFHPSRFAIDPVDLPIGAVADHTETRAVLRAGAGAVIQLPVVYHRSVTARIVNSAGTPLVPGTVATLNGSRTATVGWDGVILIEDLAGTIIVEAGSGTAACHATVASPKDGSPLADVGVITCR